MKRLLSTKAVDKYYLAKRSQETLNLQLILIEVSFLYPYQDTPVKHEIIKHHYFLKELTTIHILNGLKPCFL